MFLSFAQVAFATDAGTAASDMRTAQYKVALAQCDVMANKKQDTCRTTAGSAYDYSKRTAFVIDNNVPTDSQGRLQFDP